MKFTTSAATIGLYREWGERYNLNELVLAVAIIHWTNFRKWKFDSSKGMFFYPSKQISFSQLVKNINMSESTAHLDCSISGARLPRTRRQKRPSPMGFTSLVSGSRQADYRETVSRLPRAMTI